MLLATQPNLFTALGIDWRTMALQAVAFLVVALVLEKWVYPPLVKVIDAKRQQYEEAEQLKQAAEQALADAKQSAEQIIVQANADARATRRSADQEATALVAAARDKAAVQARRMVADGRQKLDRDMAIARRDLKHETAELVATATAAILQKQLKPAEDAELVADGLEIEP